MLLNDSGSCSMGQGPGTAYCHDTCSPRSLNKTKHFGPAKAAHEHLAVHRIQCL
jgi:hypothetical protein